MTDRELHGAVSGVDVRLLQSTLNALGFDAGDIDAVYGPNTAAAVRRYQADRGLRADGLVGPRTWAQLSREDGSTTWRQRLHKPIVGMTAGPDVEEVQQALHDAGFDPGLIDGAYGPVTATAVRDFQWVHGLWPDGIVGPQTRDALLARQLRLSRTVAGVVRSEPAGRIGPHELAQRILTRRPEYGLSPGTLWTFAQDDITLPWQQWLAQVRTLFESDRAPILHGLLVLIGLSLLVRARAITALVDQLQEPLDRLLTDRGRELAGRDPAEYPFDRLSPSSVHALSYADGLRVAADTGRVHMEHLFGGLVAKPSGPARRLLDAAGVGTEGFRQAVAEKVGVALPDSATSQELARWPDLSRHVTLAVDHAYRLADATGSPAVRTRHLLHGALSVADCGMVKALAARGVHAGDVAGWDEPWRPVPVPEVQPALLAGAAADTVPEPGDGRVRRADQLDTFAEVEMLVSVLLAQDTPLPLAVGLFGDWGSGKSFFMALMHERMAELAELARQGRPEAAPFCREIRQIHFNAWHYVDTDLWSSLAATLFDELAGAGAPSETQVKLNQLDEARTKARTAHRVAERLEQETRDLAAAIERPAPVVRNAAAVAIRAVRETADLREALRESAAETPTPDPTTDRLVSALGDVRGAGEKAGVTWRLVEEEVLHRRRLPTLLTLAVFLAVAVGVSVFTGWPAAAKVVTFLGAVAVALTPALDGALRVLYLAREARERRAMPLMAKRDDLARARTAEAAADREVERRERELAELRDKGLQLQTFVRERAASPDYRARLGVISKVRRDFEQLVALVPGGGEPPGAEQVAVAAEEVSRRIPEVERIILYVDDLDRCPNAKVVEVLQAVHLLLAFKLFIVVVGVDSRWLERSLQAHYRNLLDQPDNYLEKIFQIPFTLRRMTPRRYRQLVDRLTPAVRPADPITSAPDSTRPVPETTPAQRREPENRADVPEPEPTPLPRPEALVISEAERTLLGRLGAIVPTPRAAKRLVNIYRILRVSVPKAELEAFSPTGGREYQAVILLLAVLVGRPKLTEQVLTAVMRAQPGDDVWSIFSRLPEIGPHLEALRPHVALDHTEPYRRWAPRVSRFSFRLATAPMPEDDPG